MTFVDRVCFYSAAGPWPGGQVEIVMESTYLTPTIYWLVWLSSSQPSHTSSNGSLMVLWLFSTLHVYAAGNVDTHGRHAPLKAKAGNWLIRWPWPCLPTNNNFTVQALAPARPESPPTGIRTTGMMAFLASSFRRLYILQLGFAIIHRSLRYSSLQVKLSQLSLHYHVDAISILLGERCIRILCIRT